MSLRVENGTPINVPNTEEQPFFNLGPEFIGPPVHGTHSLGIRRVRQIRDSWCWAACTEMVLSVFGHDVKKCEVAESFLEEEDCCSGFKKACDQGVDPPDIKRIYKKFFNIKVDFVPHRVAFTTIQKQIDDEGLPVEVLINWEPDEGKHVILVDGWQIRNQVRYVKVKDPYYSDGEVRLSDLIEGEYQGTGKWKGTWIGFEEVE